MARSDPKVLIFYALSREISGFKRRLEERSSLDRDGLRGLSGRVGRAQIELIATGIGTTRARQYARRALKAFPECRLAISTGVAGALSEGLDAADLVLADRLLLGGKEHSRADHILVIPQEQVSWAESVLRRAGISFATGPILTASRILGTPAAKRSAKTQSGAAAVDMESAALGLEAAAHGVPFVCVRAVLDELNDELPPNVTDEYGRVRPMAATGFFIRNPKMVLGIPRLMRNFSRAVSALADALEALSLASAGGNGLAH